ncbi:MAG TPA: hypothetical protein VJZ01_11500 [Lachnospiraceae bacterium]|nr:hypothetical protein [Lachnospiraceae bacterium]
MKVCGIYNQYNQNEAQAYLVYFEQAGRYYIEIPTDTEPVDLPLMLELFAKKGCYTVDSTWSERWVESRIVPQERQNLGQILRENHLKHYDSYRLLLLSQGICSQDDCYVEELPESEVPPFVQERLRANIKDVLVSRERLVVFFHNQSVRLYRLEDLPIERDATEYVKNYFAQVHVEAGGYGIEWNGVIDCSAVALMKCGMELPLSHEDFCHFATQNVLNTAEVCERLECTRQNADDLIKRDKLHPIKTAAKNKMFLRSEVESRLW